MTRLGWWAQVDPLKVHNVAKIINWLINELIEKNNILMRKVYNR